MGLKELLTIVATLGHEMDVYEAEHRHGWGDVPPIRRKPKAPRPPKSEEQIEAQKKRRAVRAKKRRARRKKGHR